MKVPHSSVTEAERKYLDLLSGECSRIFSTISLPSHDLAHHIRVWKYASQLITRLWESGMTDDLTLADKTIIAAFFHDTGLTVNSGPDHGRESMLFCKGFVDKTDLPSDQKEEILEAVMKHDDKEYTSSSDASSLASVIAVADDMDAFGEEGIVRYAEIYSMRGIPESDMPGMIVANVRSRLKNLASTYRMFPDLVKEQEARAKIVTDYFTID